MRADLKRSKWFSTLGMTLFILCCGESTSAEVAPAESSTGEPVAAFRFDFDDGWLEGTLSNQEEFGTRLAGQELEEGVSDLWVHARSQRQRGTRLYVTAFAEDVEGFDPEQRFFRNSHLFIKGEGWSPNLRLPVAGLGIGRYRVNLAIEDGPEQDLFFEILPAAPPATRPTEALPPRGPNIASKALGGILHSYSGQRNDKNWKAENLIDGFSQTYDRRGGQPSSGWLLPMTEDAPPEVVFSFHENRVARIGTVVLDLTRTVVSTDYKGAAAHSSEIPRHVEIWVGDTEDDAAFQLVSRARIHNEVGWQWIQFDPVDARYLKLRLLNNYGDRQVVLAEVLILEAASENGSIIADREIDLASPALGGGLVRLTSQDPRYPAAGMFHVDDQSMAGWRSYGSKGETAAYLPQDFLFSFSGDRAGYIDFVEITPAAESDDQVGADWVRSVSIAVTNDQFSDFREVARSEIPKTAEPHQIPVGEEARYLRVRLLENHGGDRTTIGRMRIVEGTPSGYRSLAMDHTRTMAEGRIVEQASSFEAPGPDQHEPNDSAAEAFPFEFGRRVSGNLHDSVDEDYFQLEVTGTEPQAVTFDLSGTPNIRTALKLEAAGQPVKNFLPDSNLGKQTEFTWQVDPNTYHLGVYEPPLSIVVVWDTSGSMEGRTDALEAAVRTFLSETRPGQRVQLVRFADRVEVLLEDFSSDGARIQEALENNFKPLGATAFIDALETADSLLAPVSGRRVIVAFTDGQDTASKTQTGDFWGGLEAGSAQIFAIGLGNELANYSHRTGSTGHQFLHNMAVRSNGRYFHARNEQGLQPIFDAISAELRARPDYSFSATASTRPGTLRVLSVGERIPALSPPRFELILDGSGSMKRTVADGRTRMEVARTVLKEIIEDIPDDVEVGLRVFGHRIAEGQPGDCADTELLQPMERIDKGSLLSRIDGVQALGTTLIAHTLEQLPDDLGAQNKDQFVVLVTDGEEECRTDLPETVQRLKDEGLKMSLSIIGFAIDDLEIISQLEEVAAIGGGVFVQAEAGEELKAALDQALAAAYEVRDADGQVVASGSVNGSSLALPSGVYDVVVSGASGDLHPIEISIRPGADTVLELDRQGSEIGITAK